MYQADFGPCWAKLNRAIEHRHSLDNHIKETFGGETNRACIGIKYKPETGEHAVYISLAPDYTRFLERCSLLISDAIHNLRSGLDYLTFQLALANKDGTIDNERRVQFPIEDKPEMFKRRCKAASPKDSAAWIGELSGDAQQILKRYQPYHDSDRDDLISNLKRLQEGNPIFFAFMRELSDTDKHRLPTPVLLPPLQFDKAHIGVGVIANAHIRRERDRFVSPFPKTIEPGAEVFHALLPDWPETNVNVAGYITPLPSIHFMGGFVQPIQSLDEIVKVSTKLFREFDPRP